MNKKGYQLKDFYESYLRESEGSDVLSLLSGRYRNTGVPIEDVIYRLSSLSDYIKSDTRYRDLYNYIKRIISEISQDANIFIDRRSIVKILIDMKSIYERTLTKSPIELTLEYIFKNIN